MIVLAVNVGSSSLKLSLFDVTNGDDAPVGAQSALWEADHPSPFDNLPALIASAWTAPDSPLKSASDIQAVGHRVVHGGDDVRESAVATAVVCGAIARAGSFAPAHNALELSAIAAAADALGPDVPQIAVFDTSFHNSLPAAAFTYAGPYEWLALGIRRFGFHGISHWYASRRAAALAGRTVQGLRIVTCHLGSGCSLAAVQDGKSVDTTMGFTPLDGVVMATRSGAVDPGILLHLLRNGETVDSLDSMLNKRSGLAGLSGLSGDMRELLDAIRLGNARARLALDVYVHRMRQGIASMVAGMGGLDLLVFTGGVGEHATTVRSEICSGLGFLGVQIDERLNEHCDGEGAITPPSHALPVVVVRARENLVVAREAARMARLQDIQ